MKTRHERLIHPWNLPSISEPDSATSQHPVQPRQLTPAERQARRRWQKRMYDQRRYWGDVEASREYHRVHGWNWLERNRERRRKFDRTAAKNRRMRLKATDSLGYAVYLQDRREYCARNRDKIRTYNRERNRKNRDTIRAQQLAKRMQKPGYISQEERLQRARARDAWIVMLRGQGLSWKQVAERVGSTEGCCRKTYAQTMKRRGQQQVNKEKRRTQQRERDAFLLSSYREGMTWKEYARITGYDDPSSARDAYLRALDRATRPEQQDTPEQSA